MYTSFCFDFCNNLSSKMNKLLWLITYLIVCTALLRVSLHLLIIFVTYSPNLSFSIENCFFFFAYNFNNGDSESLNSLILLSFTLKLTGKSYPLSFYLLLAITILSSFFPWVFSSFEANFPSEIWRDNFGIDLSED